MNSYLLFIIEFMIINFFLLLYLSRIKLNFDFLGGISILTSGIGGAGGSSGATSLGGGVSSFFKIGGGVGARLLTGAFFSGSLDFLTINIT
ncbi:MAG: hypothetical protein MRY21_08185 [Simkaniaceae bacterium]|nr:hypothetical protein [Simkaniaceae bacterium]